jgi:anti-sigma regulatory factor (Ser/Thr protein kinase)
MHDLLTLHVRNSLDEIPHTANVVSLCLAERQASLPAIHFARLAVEELLSNCVKYAFADAAEHLIEITLSIEGGDLILTFTDDGLPFNPLTLPEPRIHVPIEERGIGGLGIHLLRKIADDLHYSRTDGKNRLTLRKSLSA